MPGFVKIGLTENQLETRIKQLDNTSVPLNFECFYAARVADCQKAEKLLHDAFDDYRTRSNREFFEIDPERVRSALLLAVIEDVTPTLEEITDKQEREAIAKSHNRNPAATFEMVGIEPGSVLVYEKDPTITCTVKDARKIEFRGETLSLSAATLKILHEAGYEWRTCNGWNFWRYEDKKLGHYYNLALGQIKAS